jgi:nucleoside-diphosphate-sugar epimerase
MNIFISGGAGFIGSHLLRRLLKEEKVSRVVIFDNFTSGRRSYLDANIADSLLRIVEADLKDLDALKTAMQGCETIYHLAANPDIAKAVTQPDIDFWEGTYLTQNVLEAMRATSARTIVYASGSGVYGEECHGCLSRRLWSLYADLNLRREQTCLRRIDFRRNVGGLAWLRNKKRALQPARARLRLQTLGSSPSSLLGPPSPISLI